MNIKRVYIDGFKNLENVNVVLSKITGLLSVNNFGKSNYLTAIDFALSFISANQKVKKQMMAMKTCISILNKTFGKNFKFEIEFESTLDNENCDVIYGYEFKWDISVEDESKIVREYLKVKQKDTQKYSSYIERDIDESLYKPSITSRCDKEISIKNNELLINKLQAYDNLFYSNLIETINEFEVYMDRHYDSDNLFRFNPFIEREINYFSSSNNDIARTLNYLKQNHKDRYELIVNTLKDLFPDIQDFEIQEIDLNRHVIRNELHEEVSFKLSESEYILYVTTKNIFSKIQFSNMSDGVKRILLILTHITLAELSSMPLIAIEEPENSIHPGLFKKYLIALTSFVQNSKIIITSHSPYLINFMNLSDIYIGISNDDGEAKFKKIKDTAVSKINNHAEDMDMMAGEYLFDLMSGYDKSSIESLKKYLENE